MTVHIVAHHDADGIIASHLVRKMHRGEEVVVHFQQWDRFGFWPEDARRLEGASLVYILDLGCSKETLEAMKMLDGEAVLIDHHPTEASITQYVDPLHRVVHSTDNCTVGLVYEYAKVMGAEMDRWYKLWTVVGIYGDVASELPEARQILHELRDEVRETFWQAVYWDGRHESLIPLPALWGRYLNTAHRVAWSEGAYVALRSLEEIEKEGIELLEDPFTGGSPVYFGPKDARNPYTALLRAWYRDWLNARDIMFREEYTRTYEFPGVRVAITNFPYQIAGWVAMVKATDTKPCLCVNYGSPSTEHAELSGRSRGQDLLRIAKLLKAVLGDRVNIGGHREAVGGWVSKALSRYDFLSAVERATSPEFALEAGDEGMGGLP